MDDWFAPDVIDVDGDLYAYYGTRGATPDRPGPPPWWYKKIPDAPD